MNSSNQRYWFGDEEVILPQSLTPVEPIGQGASSIVFSAVDENRSRLVAIKKLKNVLARSSSSLRALNEVLIMRLLQHGNIISFEGLVIPDRSSKDLYIISDIFETDLGSVLKSPQDLSSHQIRVIFFQLMCGLNYMHSVGVIHRDIKPRNLLVSASCNVKICDFGIAWFTQLDDPLAGNVVCTRWYRPPELLCLSPTHNNKVDIFSAGCVLAELISRKPLLPGCDEEEQLFLYVKRFGSVFTHDFACLPESRYSKMLRSMCTSSTLGDCELYLGRNSTKELIELVRSLCVFDPAKRPSAGQVLELSIFSDFEPVRSDSLVPWRIQLVDRLDKKTVNDLLHREAHSVNGKKTNEDDVHFPKLSAGTIADKRFDIGKSNRCCPNLLSW